MTELQLIHPDWPAHSRVCAVATTRHGGSSSGVYGGLNLGGHVGDDPGRVAANREILRRTLRLPAEPRWLEQVHGTGLVHADDIAGRIAADAAWTDTPGIVCAVLTADCLPLLFCTRVGTRIAVVHAGWRGLSAGIIAAMADNFRRAAIAPDDILVWLGPAIGPAAYEVDATVHDAVLRHAPECAGSFTATRPGHWNFSLYAAARAILAGAGITHVSGGELCTYSDPRFYSYRRDSRCGRQASLIWLSDTPEKASPT